MTTSEIPGALGGFYLRLVEGIIGIEQAELANLERYWKRICLMDLESL